MDHDVVHSLLEILAGDRDLLLFRAEVISLSHFDVQDLIVEAGKGDVARQDFILLVGCDIVFPREQNVFAHSDPGGQLVFI